MVSIKSFIYSSTVFIATLITVEAAIAPNYPSPGTIQVEGNAYDITWTFDQLNASTTYKIDFMTGSNSNQVFLANVAQDVKPDALKCNFITPEVSPNAAIYFFMFTGSDGSYYWTTRFGIVKADGVLEKETETIQPDGDKIPWGTGQLLASSVSVSASEVAAGEVSVTDVPATEVSKVTDASQETLESTSALAQSIAPQVTKESSAWVLKPALGLVSALTTVFYIL